MMNTTHVITWVVFSYTLFTQVTVLAYFTPTLPRSTHMSDMSRWGTVKDAGALLGVHPMTIRRYINAGELPARRKGIKLIEVDLDAVRRLAGPIEPTVIRTGVYADRAEAN